MQVPADQVIALLTQDLADYHRENAILKVQVEILTNQNSQLQQAPASAPAHAEPTSTDTMNGLPPIPATLGSPTL